MLCIVCESPQYAEVLEKEGQFQKKSVPTVNNKRDLFNGYYNLTGIQCKAGCI